MPENAFSKIDSVETITLQDPAPQRITVNVDRLENNLNKYRNIYQKITNNLFIFIAFITPIFTAQFNDVFGIENSKYTIGAIYIVISIFSLILILYYGFHIFYKKSKYIKTFEFFVEACVQRRDRK